MGTETEVIDKSSYKEDVDDNGSITSEFKNGKLILKCMEVLKQSIK